MPNTFKNYTARNVGTTATTVYTAATATTSTVIGMTICNTSTSTVKVSIAVNDGADTYMIGSAVPNNNGAIIAPGNSLVAVGGDQKLVLEATNSIKVISNTASSVDVIISALEIT